MEKDTLMGSEVEGIEERLKSFVGQLQMECSIFERIVYKNKNQHRRCSYFQYLLKVRRDLKLLQSTKLEEILGSCFNIITGKRPKQKVNLLESLKRKTCDGGKHNFMERLLGVARLLSQIVEPMLKAAIEISTLLARSFFMGFSVTVLALLARLRVLVQQIFLDVVSVFNMVSSLSQQKQSVKINQDGIEVFREFYPTIKEFVILECVWKVDKFVLHEKLHKGEIKSQGEGDLSIETCLEAPIVQYESIESFLGDDEPGSTADGKVEEGPTHNPEKTDLPGSLSAGHNEREKHNEDGKINETASSMHLPSESAGTSKHNDGDSGMATIQTGAGTLSVCSNPLKRKLGGAKDKVLFVAVKKPTPSAPNVTGDPFKEAEKKSGHNDDPFFSLLAGGGNLKDSLF